MEYNRVIAEEHQEWAEKKAEREVKTKGYADFDRVAEPPSLDARFCNSILLKSFQGRLPNGE